MRIIPMVFAAAGAFCVMVAPSLARADWDGHDGWRRHEWREHQWREHEWRERAWRAYPPPPVVYAPPPAAYYALPPAAYAPFPPPLIAYPPPPPIYAAALSTCWTEVAMVRDWDGVPVVMPQR